MRPRAYISGKTEEDPSDVDSAISNTSTAAGTLISMGQYDAAVVFADLALPIVSNDCDLLMTKGKTLSALEKDEDASACYDLIFAERPERRRSACRQGDGIVRDGEIWSVHMRMRWTHS